MSYIDALKDSNFKKAMYDFLTDRMTRYSRDAKYSWNDEDSLTQAFISAVTGVFSHEDLTVQLRGYKVRGRGPNAPERKLGADGFGLVFIETSHINLRGFFLFQSKKATNFTEGIENAAKSQCQIMLGHTAASQLLILLPNRVAFIGAIAVISSNETSPSLEDLPFVGFPALVINELLHGLMMSPLDYEPFKNNPVLSTEISSILAIVVRDTSLVGNAAEDEDTRTELSKLGFDDLESLKSVE